MGNHSKRMSEALAATRRLMWIKRGIPLGLLAIWMTVVPFLIWHQGSPEEWKAETVRFARMNEITTKTVSRWGSNYHQYDVLVTEDGQEFRFREGVEVLLPLSVGEECRLVHEKKGDQVMYIRALSTAEDGVLVALEDSIDAHQETVRFLWWMLAAGAISCLLALGLIEAFGVKVERTVIAWLKGKNKQA